MEKIAKYINKNKNLIKKSFSVIFVIAFVIISAIEIRNINFEEYHSLFLSMSFINKIKIGRASCRERV